ncbi:biotin--[acetyl-CoA-carboxylase] ligase [Anaeromicropila populeti]|uniref:Bifunctional ligase/repressor BirA n=1 Tax=Anaeromicropila populeti TaxID=37658 RepID=A0A1I6JZA9_9FIRM|nr:biotin--[acetyl-CoA-carboxylase] ligase [Anaeromicropila populeti]SFR84297.1 BirA family transcriptional regulator, biotin operon repressor / biotin-[acetyl-CoA-carboxylase] ligase [Anaeromicropila populeti]
MKEKILKMLTNTQESVSGQQLSDSLGVSRTAVWKVINQLKAEGYQIEAVPNRGYKIIEYPDLITAEAVKSLLQTKIFGKEVRFYDEIDSTNMEARRHAEAHESHGMVILAEQQNAGKGRRGRNWVSPKGTGIWMSLILKPEFAPEKASMLTLLGALAGAEAIKDCTGLDCRIKWPNDLVVNGKKVCGILTEMSSEIDYIHYVIIGMGINVNADFFPDDICHVATSLKLEGKQNYMRNQIAAKILFYLEKHYEKFCNYGDLRDFVKEYNLLLINRGKEVKIIDSNHTFTGEALGIDSEGRLLVKDAAGQITEVMSGEVSVRGLYGYV